jgi:hypothetical protein
MEAEPQSVASYDDLIAKFYDPAADK